MSIDHVFIPVTNIDSARAFYAAALAPLGWGEFGAYDSAAGPDWIPNLYGFGDGSGDTIWLRETDSAEGWAHVGFAAANHALVEASYEAAIAAGATDNRTPGVRAHFAPNYYASNVYDLDGNSLEFVNKG